MSGDMMTFPQTVGEFMEMYKIIDTEGIYMSKGSEFVPIFRMKQWFEHKSFAQPEQKWISCSERLPKKNGEYLVTFRLHIIKCIDVSYYDGHAFDTGLYDEVLAWMPLPEPYMEDKA